MESVMAGTTRPKTTTEGESILEGKTRPKTATEGESILAGTTRQKTATEGESILLQTQNTNFPRQSVCRSVRPLVVWSVTSTFDRVFAVLRLA